MPWCPVCKNEYREGYTHCNDCDVDLVDSLEEGPRALIAGAEYDMNRMAELLQAKDVDCFVRPGQRKDEFELYVTEEHAERATAYLQSYVQAMMQQQTAQPQQPQAAGWTCGCGAVNTTPPAAADKTTNQKKLNRKNSRHRSGQRFMKIRTIRLRMQNQVRSRLFWLVESELYLLWHLLWIICRFICSVLVSILFPVL